ncbi:MAG TPA: DNA-binding protein [Candidatus Nanoarchaeia archaeon]|nr:DNA-binding protein [Candidatus Nanoarchaeia archaeon]
MSDAEEIKRRKLEQLKRQFQDNSESQMQQEAQAQQQVDALEALIKTKLTKDALQRYSNIKAADPDKAMQILLLLAQLIQSGRADMIDDRQLKKLLMLMSSGKRDIKITRR